MKAASYPSSSLQFPKRPRDFSLPLLALTSRIDHMYYYHQLLIADMYVLPQSLNQANPAAASLAPCTPLSLNPCIQALILTNRAFVSIAHSTRRKPS